MMNAKVFSVSEINKYAKNLLEQDAILDNVFIEGEISNLRQYQSGHVYLTLKDSKASINSVIWVGSVRHLAFEPENGLKVICKGYINIYEKTAAYQLNVEYMEVKGLGSTYLAFEQSKKKLEKEGLFLDEHKKTIEKYPREIAVVSSEDGAVIHDIKNVAKSRNPLVKIELFSAKVQGEKAVSELINALERADKSDADFIIIARGGGSYEDLISFNDENLARAVFNCKKAVISAIGHETDFTIIDFVSDLRASTPSHAAEISLPLLSDIYMDLEYYKKNANKLFENIIIKKTREVEKIKNSFALKRPNEKIINANNHLKDLKKELRKNIDIYLNQKSNLVEKTKLKLEILSPYKPLERGYSLLLDDNKLVKDAKNIKADKEYLLKFRDGDVIVKLVKRCKNGENEF